MQNSQTLKDLANLAKANQDEFNNTLIEIHKQSVLQIGQDLKNSLNEEMNEIKNDITKTLSPIILQTQNIRKDIIREISPSLLTRIFNGLVLTIAMIFFILGFLTNFWLNGKEMQYYQTENTALKKWQIPMNYRLEQINNKTGEKEKYLVIPPQTTIQTRNGTQYLKINH